MPPVGAPLTISFCDVYNITMDACSPVDVDLGELWHVGFASILLNYPPSQKSFSPRRWIDKLPDFFSSFNSSFPPSPTFHSRRMFSSRSTVKLDVALYCPRNRNEASEEKIKSTRRHETNVCTFIFLFFFF